MTEKWAVLVSAAGFLIAAIVFFFQEKVLVAAVDAIGSIVLVTIAFLQMRQKKKEK